MQMFLPTTSLVSMGYLLLGLDMPIGRPIKTRIPRRLLNVQYSLCELQNLIDGNDRRTDQQNCLPFVPVEWDNGEQALKEWNVEKRKVQCHGEADCIYEHHVLPQRKSHERLAGRQCVHCVEHLNYHEDGERHG